MNVLFVGEIVGKWGRKAAGEVLPAIIKKNSVDVVFANVENIAHGKGATEKTLNEVQSYGINAFTSGNHIFWRGQGADILEQEKFNLIRPANYPGDIHGKGHQIIDLTNNGKILLINLAGRSLNDEPLDCPFRTIDAVLENYADEKPSAIVVDFHAETTSERVAMGWYLDGRAALVVGSHTHVPTADARILPMGTAFVADIGMVGAQNSVLGVDRNIIIDKFKYPYPQRFEWSEDGPAVFNSVLVTVGDKGQAESIERVDRVVDF